MPEPIDLLKRYIPYPLFLIVMLFWWVGSDPFKERIQAKFKENEAVIQVDPKNNDVQRVHVEVTPEAAKDFDEVQVQIDLQAQPTKVTAELSSLDGSHPFLAVTSSNAASTSYLISRRLLPDAPISLRHREAIEISVTEPGANRVVEVWLSSKDRQTIRLSDINQRWPVAEIAWRSIGGLLALVGFFLFRKPVRRLFYHKNRRRLAEEIEFLRLCAASNSEALNDFKANFQPIIDRGARRYLKAFAEGVREPTRQVLIAHEIFRRADTLPQLRRPLQAEIEEFVILWCLKFFARQFEAVKALAENDRNKIGK